MSIGKAIDTLRGTRGSPGYQTQAEAAALITKAGFTLDQGAYSKIRRGERGVNIEQANIIEGAYGKPRGWIYAIAGYVDVLALCDLFSAESAGRNPRPGRSTSRAESAAAIQRALERSLHEAEPPARRQRGR